MKNILITGGSGLVGRRITTLLESKGYQVAWLSRTVQEQTYFLWDVARQELDPQAITWADAVIHLAGEPIAERRWSDNVKAAIRTGLPDKDSQAMAYLAMSQIYLRRRENKAARDFFNKAKAAKPKSEEVVKQIKEMDKYLSKMPG